MAQKSYSDAAIPNPMLKPFEVLIGEWTTAGTHPLIPQGTIVHGHSSFEWMEGGAFLKGNSSIEYQGFPTGIAIFGSDDAAKEYFMMYFDERTVSRKYEVSFQGNVMKWWRDDPAFAQRYTFTISDDGNTIVGKGELCQDGTNWEPDLSVTYTRVK